MITLRQLRFLVALADELHFSRAAEACHVAQPTLSAGLKELETALGVTLAERTRRSVVLTPAGRRIAERGRRVLADIRDIEELAMQFSGPLRGELRFGAIPTIGPFLLPKALPALRAAYPDLRLYLREELTEPLVEGLLSGRLDMILMALPFDLEGVATTPLFDDGYQLATPRDHPIALRPAARGDDLVETPLLLLERGHCLQRHALSAFPQAPIRQDDSFAATSLATLTSMVEEGLGVTLLPDLAIDAGATAGAAIALTRLDGACPRHVVLACRRNSPLAADIDAVAGIFRTAREELRAAATAPRPA